MSYDATTTIKSISKHGIEITVWAGSYNPGYQPSYGHDWQYYHVDVTDKNNNYIARKVVSTEKEALVLFREFKERYLVVRYYLYVDLYACGEISIESDSRRFRLLRIHESKKNAVREAELRGLHPGEFKIEKKIGQ